ncbi:hypothetical protein PQX77_007323 [Marasmius sp. AFHP31]|nr:hypothetical protein PQX77_007323 [Marasmius sp. AFHP31]
MTSVGPWRHPPTPISIPIPKVVPEFHYAVHEAQTLPIKFPPKPATAPSQPWKERATPIPIPKPGSQPNDCSARVRRQPSIVEAKRKRGFMMYISKELGFNSTFDRRKRGKRQRRSRFENGKSSTSGVRKTSKKVRFDLNPRLPHPNSLGQPLTAQRPQCESTTRSTANVRNVGGVQESSRGALNTSTGGEARELATPITINLREMSFEKLRSIFRQKLELPVYSGPCALRTDNKPVAFCQASGNFMNSLFDYGHVEALRKRLYDLVPSWKTAEQDIFYFPFRQIYVEDQHAVVVGPATQDLPEYQTKVVSPFEKMYGKERPLFHAMGPHKNRQVYYMGTYRCEKLDHHFPEGFLYEGGTAVTKQIARCAVESQLNGDTLAVHEVTKLLRGKKLKLEFAIFQLVDFDFNVYELLATPATRKRGGLKRRRS